MRVRVAARVVLIIIDGQGSDLGVYFKNFLFFIVIFITFYYSFEIAELCLIQLNFTNSNSLPISFRLFPYVV